ncbi:MAG: N-6 DNA methylase, partial [Salinivirgaceae bacterium]|nr:N-6 DNA methylase [Salinivirgaceae bacterium]
KKDLSSLEARHAKLKVKIFDEEGNQREGVSQKAIDNYNALTAAIESQRAEHAKPTAIRPEASGLTGVDASVMDGFTKTSMKPPVPPSSNVEAAGGKPKGKSPYGTGANWVKTDKTVTPDAVVGVEVKTQGEQSDIQPREADEKAEVGKRQPVIVKALDRHGNTIYVDKTEYNDSTKNILRKYNAKGERLASDNGIHWSNIIFDLKSPDADNARKIKRLAKLEKDAGKRILTDDEKTEYRKLEKEVNEASSGELKRTQKTDSVTALPEEETASSSTATPETRRKNLEAQLAVSRHPKDRERIQKALEKLKGKTRAISEVKRAKQERDDRAADAENQVRLQKLGQEHVPGVRAQDAAEAGRMWEMKENGDVSAQEWYDYVANLVASNKVAKAADPNIGREWDSPYGRQRIVSRDTTGPGVIYDVQTIGKDEIRRYRADQIEFIISRDEYALTPEYEAEQRERAENAKLKEERESRQAEKDKQIDEEIAAFTSGMSNIAAGKAKAVLLKRFRFSDGAMTRKECVEKRIAEGHTVTGTGNERRLEDAKGVGLGVKALTKTGMDYAEFLLRGKETKQQPESIEKPSLSKDDISPLRENRDPTKILDTLEKAWDTQMRRFDMILSDPENKDVWKRVPSKEAAKKYITEQVKAGETGTVQDFLGDLSQMSDEEYKKYEGTEPEAKAEPENTIFTEDAYQKAKARMKSKLSQLNAGLDPELLTDGMTIAGYHLERGSRKFADYAKAMVNDFGDAIRPYLKAFYNGVRDLPGIEWTSEMDDYQTVQGASVDARKEGEEQPNEIQRFAEDMRQTQARWDAANDRATELGTPGALAAQEKFENGDMEVEEFERILDGEAQQKRELTPAESTKIPVIDSGKGKPNTVYRDMYGLYDGAHLGLVEEPYDGTLEGLMEAYYKVQARFNDFNNASNMESPIAATDESGKAKYRLSPNGRFIYDLQNGDEINTDAYKDKKAEAEAEIVGDTPFTLTSHDSLFKRLRDGEPVTVDEVKKGFDSLIESEEAIKAELQAMKKDDLLKRMGRFAAGRYKNEKKDVIVSAIYRGMVTDFAYLDGSNSLSYGMRDKVSDVVRKRVEKLTEEGLKKYAEAVAKERDDYKTRMEGYVKAIKDPETWEEFQKYRELGYKIEDLSPEKLKLYDELKAEHNREQKAREAEKKATVSQVKTDVEMTLKETTHTKKGTPLFVVQLSDRVERDVYNGLNAAAKKLGGYYSSFRGAGAVPGFQFKTREDAEKFMAIREGDVSRADKLEEKAEERQEKKVSKLRAVAESLKEKAEEQLSRDRLTNTAKRARQASGAEESARSDIQLAETMLNLADAIESGEATHLDGVAAKTHVETLKGLLRSAKYAYEEAKDIPYIDSKNRTVTEDDVDFAKYPYPAQHESHIRDLATFLKDKKGAAMDAAWLSKMVKERTHDSIVSFIQPGDIERLESILAKTKRFVKDSSAKSAIENIADRMQDYNRLQRMGIPDLPSLRAALREFLKFRAGRREADKAKQLERDLVGKKVGVDFFPTPPELAGRMVEMAGVEPGMRVLEPSAGNGNIAEAIRDAGIEPDVAEISSSLRKVLEAKGFSVVGQDFMDVDGEYDAIIMNPPFSNNQDIEHVRHAFDLLKPGGKLVAIMGEGAFFRGGKTENAFREWIDEQGAEVEKLPEGTFTDRTLLTTTGVNARLVVLTKEAEKKARSDNKVIAALQEVIDRIGTVSNIREAQQLDADISKISSEIKRFDSNLAHKLMKKGEDGAYAAIELNTHKKVTQYSHVVEKGNVAELRNTIDDAIRLLEKEDAENARLRKETREPVDTPIS